MDGSPAVPIGEGTRRRRCLQTGGGCSRCPEGIWSSCRLGPVRWSRCRRETSTRVGDGAWLADSKRIVFTGDPGDGKPRGYIQEIPAGMPRAITPEGVVLAGKAAVRDDNSILGRVGATWALFPIHGGDGRPFRRSRPEISRCNGATTADTSTRSTTSTGPGRPAVDVFRVELATGGRVLWKTLTPSDPVGVEDMRETVVITPDAQSYCYSYMRRLGDLFVVDGLEVTSADRLAIECADAGALREVRARPGNAASCSAAATAWRCRPKRSTC